MWETTNTPTCLSVGNSYLSQPLMFIFNFQLLKNSSCFKNHKVAFQDFSVRKNKKKAKIKICAFIDDCNVLLPARKWACCWLSCSSILMSYTAKLLLLVLSSALTGLWHHRYSRQGGVWRCDPGTWVFLSQNHWPTQQHLTSFRFSTRGLWRKSGATFYAKFLSMLSKRGNLHSYMVHSL